MHKALAVLAASAATMLFTAGAYAQSGSVAKAVGGYSFEDAAKEAEATKKFHSDDGQLTFALVTHTAGNGFFDPVYVGALAAANLIGAKVLLLGAESPTDDPARAIEITNQIIQDPTLDGLIMTTPQVGAYDDIVKTAEKNGIPVATTNSFDGQIYNRSGISHTGQDASAAGIAGEALVKCLADKGIEKGSIVLPSSTAMGNIEVNNRVTSAFNAIVKGLKDAGKLENFKVDAGPENTGIDTNPNDPVNGIVTLFESRGDVVGAFAGNNVFTPALAKAVAQTGKTGADLCLRLRSRPGPAGGPEERRSDRCPGSAAVPAGLLARHAAVAADRPRHCRRQPRHPRSAGDQGQRRPTSASGSRTDSVVSFRRGGNASPEHL